MSRIPLSPGVKERVSANVGRLLRGRLLGDREYNEADIEIFLDQALRSALAIEVAVSEALAVDTSPTAEGKPF